MDTQELEKVLGPADRALSARRVYGEPYESGGVTLIPAAAVRGGGGGGVGRGFGGSDPEGRGTGSGSGFGLIARPVGAFVIREGKLRWQPAIDANRVILGAQLLAALALLLAAAIIRRRTFAPRILLRRR